MLPRAPKNIPRKLVIPEWVYKEVETIQLKNKFWFISWLGESYVHNGIIYRDYLITLCNNTHLKFQRGLRTFVLRFREETTIRHKQGNYYDFLGYFVSTAANLDGIQKLKGIIINKRKNSELIDIKAALGNKKTFYPLLDSDFYGLVPIYNIYHNGTSYIIPLNVIQSYFYATSALNIYYLTYGIFAPNVISPFQIDDTAIISFRSSEIAVDEAKFLSKFYFLNHGTIESLYKVHGRFQHSITNKQKNQEEPRSYIIYELPFEADIELKMDFYHHPVDIENKISMVYAIANVELANNEPLFSVENYILNDLDNMIIDSHPSENELLDKINIRYNKDKNGTPSSGAIYTNNNISENIEIEIDDPKFLSSPFIVDAIPTVTKKNKTHQQSLIKHIRNYESEMQEHSSDSETGVFNHSAFLFDSSQYTQIVTEAFKLLQAFDEFECDYIYLKRADNSIFSYSPLDSDDGRIILFRISYNAKQFCVVAPSNENYRIGLLLRQGEGTFDTENDENLKNGLIKIKKDFDNNWSLLKKVRDNKFDHDFHFRVIDSLNKTNGESKEERIKSLYNRIKNSITTSQKEAKSNN